MSGRSTLRRSRRAPPKKPENFLVGQVVELNRPNEEQVHVTLTQLLTEGSSTMHPRWLVVFPDTHMEEVYEHRFGKVVTRAPGEEETPESGRSSANNSPMPPAASESKAAAAANNNTGTTSGKKSGGGSPTNSGSSGKNSPSSETDAEGKRKSVSFPHHESDGADSASYKNKSAREARSRRRQAIIDEVPGAAGGVNGSSNGASSTSNHGAIKRKNSTGSSNSKGGKKTKRPEAPSDETVTKVKLLTGTLYLYRGSHQRAEFVRRI